MKNAADLTVETLIRLGEVTRRTGLRRAAIYKRMSEGTFPRPVKIGRRAVAWVASEVDQWVQERIRAARGGDAPAPDTAKAAER